MIKKTLPYIMIALFMVSCYEIEKPKKPKNLISKEEMVNILLDLKLLVSTTGQNVKVLDSNNVDVERFVYNKYNIDSTQFALSSDYYAHNIEDYEAIYEKVKDSLEALNNYYNDLQSKDVEAGEEEANKNETVEDAPIETGLITPPSDKEAQP